jgi:acetylornithine deacetylase
LSKAVEQILSKLIAFDTTSRNSNSGCIDFIRDTLDSFGVKSEIVAGKEDGKLCLWATIGHPDKSGVVLSGHTDTVPVDGQHWTSDPFTLTDRDDKWVARGSADMKGFIACALAFVPEFLAAKTDKSFHLALTSDEETDMSGAIKLTDWLAAQGVRPEWVWIGEPTGLSIVDQHKGVAAYRTRLTGVSGHSSSPDKGLSAIELAAHFLGVFDRVVRKYKAAPYAPSRFDPACTTFNLGSIHGGTADNIIAETCEIVWQVRAHPGDRAHDIYHEIVTEAERLILPRLAPFAPQAKMEICACFDIPPFLASADNPGEKLLKKALRCDETHAVSFATEAGIFQKLGSPAVICGPGFVEQAHQPNEFVDKKQLAACVDLLRSTLLSS